MALISYCVLWNLHLGLGPSFLPWAIHLGGLWRRRFTCQVFQSFTEKPFGFVSLHPWGIPTLGAADLRYLTSPTWASRNPPPTHTPNTRPPFSDTGHQDQITTAFYQQPVTCKYSSKHFSILLSPGFLPTSLVIPVNLLVCLSHLRISPLISYLQQPLCPLPSPSSLFLEPPAPFEPTV